MSFNLKKNKVAQVVPYEKYLRRNHLGPPVQETATVTEKKLPHRTDGSDTIAEDQLLNDKTENNDAQIVEKVLAEAESYVVHRSNAADITIPPINALVEKLRQERSAEYEVNQSPHWSLTYDEKSQQGSLPKWPKNAPKHDKIVLNNDPRRVEDTSNLPTHADQKSNDKSRSTTTKIKPLVGTITTADVDNVVSKIKTGSSVDFDTAIVAILTQADKEQRELTPIEQRAIVNLKVARTNSLMTKSS